jgi:hypothetical protein
VTERPSTDKVSTFVHFWKIYPSEKMGITGSTTSKIAFSPLSPLAEIIL